MDDIMNTPTETRRDRWGRYLVVPPDGGKPTGYTRATTVAKALDDTSSLMAWGERMTAIGLARRPDLLAQVDDIADDKTALNRLCTTAKEAGGATIRRDLGTALHSILERSWTEPDYTPPAAHVDDVRAVHDALDAAGFEVVDGMNERIVVNDTHQIAGTFDLILRHRDGTQHIADIKTGSSVKFGALGFCVQLSIYAAADNLYTQGAAADGSQDHREPMPDVSTTDAVIIHVEPGSGVCTLHRLTLSPQLLDLAIQVREARKLRDLLDEIDITPDPLGAMRARVDQAIARDKSAVARLWPDGVPTPKYSSEWLTEHLPVLDAAMDKVETELSIPFGAIDVPPAEPRTPQPASTSTVEMPDEGDMIGANDLAERFAALSDDQRRWIGGVVREANAAHLPIRVKEHPTARRVTIGDGLIMLAADLESAPQRARDLLAVALDDDTALMPSLPLGAAVGLLTAAQAATWRELIALGANVEA